MNLSLRNPAMKADDRLTRKTFSQLCFGNVCCSLLPVKLRAASQTAVVVGVDQPLSGMGKIQVEPYVAAHPSNPNNLIVSGADLVDGQFQARAYASFDGGKSWESSPLKIPSTSTYSVNNWVAYAGDGNSYFSSLCQPAKAQSFIAVSRSVDSGRTWENPVRIPGDGYDQPRIVVSPHADSTVYIAARLQGVAVLRSLDSGTTFELASQVIPSNLGNQPRNPLVLTNGSLLIPFCDYPTKSEQSSATSRYYAMLSDNKGATFGSPRFVSEVPRSFPGGGGEFAVDLSAGLFRGRVYAIWEDGDFGGKLTSWPPNLKREESGVRRGIVLSYSKDLGRNWSAPKVVTRGEAGPAFMGSLAVNSKGTVGVLWVQHERYEINPRDYRIWFSASRDGGETFTSPVSVSTAVSKPNLAETSKLPYFRTRGGDYIGLAATSDSAFHAVWADARDGLFRLFHTSLHVLDTHV